MIDPRQLAAGTAAWLIGDTRAVVDTLPAGSVDLIMCSPPFLLKRNYLDADDPAKPYEIGLEGNPVDFIWTLLECVAGWRRALHPLGSIVIEIDDTYAGSGGAGGDYNPGGLRDGQPKYGGAKAKKAGMARKRTGSVTRARSAHGVPAGQRERYQQPDQDGGPMRDRALDELDGRIPRRLRTRRHLPGWPLDKSKALIPQLLEVALAYGIHPLTGEKSPAGLWLVRNVSAWCKTNPSPGDDRDKFRPGYSHIISATLAPKRWWDGTAVRVPASKNTNPRTAKGVESAPNLTRKANAGGNNNRDTLALLHSTGDTAPLLDWWIPGGRGYEGAHFATYPSEVVVPMVQAMCPRRVCVTCGQPSRRITETAQVPTRKTNGRKHYEQAGSKTEHFAQRTEADVRTIGWTTCGCAGADGIQLDGYHTGTGWRPGVVCDPFVGSGTTLAVATGHGRAAIGVDLDRRNLELGYERLGMALVEVHELVPTEATA